MSRYRVLHSSKSTIFLSIFVFIIAYFAYLLYNRYIKEYFDDIELPSEDINMDALYQYQLWVGYLFANSSKNGPALDDFKQRAFQPSCKFRGDWYNYNPTSKFSFIPAKTPEEASAAYNNFLGYLSKPDGGATPLLNDAKGRFFTEDCNFLNPEDISDYSANLMPVFR